MLQVLWTPQAESDLEEIFYYIRVKGERPLTARRIGEGIVALVDEIASGTVKGHKHPVAPSEWLYCRFKRWLLFYRTSPAEIEVMRVIDGVRDLPSLF
jgi:plasmid stabilization system protein ParE